MEFKKTIKITLLLGFLLFVPQMILAQENLSGDLLWVVENFDATYNLQKNSQVDVLEQLQVDYLVPRHGFYRTISTKYQTNEKLNYNLEIDFKSLINEKNQSYAVKNTSRSNVFEIQIGEVEQELVGKNNYFLNYQVDRAIRFFDDHDEFYWNVTGNDFDTLIKNTTATIILPQSVDMDNLQFVCYTGIYGSSEKNCEYQILDDKTVKFRSNVELGTMGMEKRGLTIAIWLPKGIIVEPSLLMKAGSLLIDNIFLLMPLLILFIMYIVWRKFGDDPDLPSIIPQYEEDNRLTPMLAEALEKNNLVKQSPAMGAEIVLLATQGYLRIEEVVNEKNNKLIDYRLVKLKAPTPDLMDYQQTLLEKLFDKAESVELKSLNNVFYRHLIKIRSQLAGHLKPYYDLSPNAKIWFFILGILILIICWILGITVVRNDLIAGGFISGIIVMVFALFMPKKNKQGQDLEWHIKGLRQYIEVAEKYRAEFYAKENMFEKVLPYAMVFGLVEKWGQEFKDIMKQPPDWYYSENPFDAIILTRSLNNFNKLTNTATARPASSSSSIGRSGSSGFSGGFSGGGFGGGGGRSW